MNPIERLINQALSSVITQTQCKLCDVRMEMPSNQKAHLASKRHKENVVLFKEQVRQSVNSTLVSPVSPANSNNRPSNAEDKPFHCKLCDRRFGTRAALNNHNSTESHMRNIVPLSSTCSTCSTCSLLLASKECLWEHLKSVAHQNQLKTLGRPPIDGKYTPFCQTSPIDLRNQMRADYCYICKISFPTIKQSVNHYTSLVHVKAAELWLKNKQVVLNQSKPKQVVEVKNQADPEQTIVCFVCNNQNIRSSNKDQHIQSFPHSVLCKEKQELLKKGISDVYLTPNNSLITCQLCQIVVYSNLALSAHINTTIHIKNYSNWIATAKRDINESEIRKFYCKVCDRDLDGTSCIELHYSGPSHTQKLALFCGICDVSNATPELLKLHQLSTFHLENLQRVEKKKLKPDTNILKSPAKSEPKTPNYSDNATNKTENAQPSLAATPTKNDNSDNMKNKVFNELEKLVQKLYYSKEVPYDFGLNYLKKINKEVDEIIIKHNDDKEKQALPIELDEAVSVNDYFNQNDLNLKNKDDDEGFTEEYAKPLLYPVNFEMNATNTLENNAKPTDTVSENNTETKRKRKRKLKKITPSFNISDLLKDIIYKKQNCKDNVDELELLNEIEILLKQLENIQDGPLLEDILKILQGFNRELDEIDFEKLKDDQKIKIEIEENATNIDEIIEIENSQFEENFEADTNNDEKIEIKHSLSEENFEAEKIVNVDNDEKIEMENSHPEENFEAEENATNIVKAIKPKSEFVYSKNELLSLKPGYNDHSETPASIYNYYSGNDFNQFMDFVEVYQQGSFDDLFDKNVQKHIVNKNDEVTYYDCYSGESDSDEFTNFKFNCKFRLSL